MRTLQLVYMPPDGTAPIVGDLLCIPLGEYKIIDILERRDNGEFLLRLGQDDPVCE